MGNKKLTEAIQENTNALYSIAGVLHDILVVVEPKKTGLENLFTGSGGTEAVRLAADVLGKWTKPKS